VFLDLSRIGVASGTAIIFIYRVLTKLIDLKKNKLITNPDSNVCLSVNEIVLTQ